MSKAGQGEAIPPDRPLTGLRVLDLGSSLPVSLCVARLAAMGARVTKLERPGGDPARKRLPAGSEGSSLRFGSLTKGVESMVIDFKRKEAGDIFERLLSGTDIVVTSLPGRVCENLGVGYARVSSVVPDVVYCRFTSYSGQEKPGHDINYLAASGGLDAAGRDGRSAIPPLPVSDVLASVVAVSSIAASLRAREISGAGTQIEIPIGECALWLGAAVFPEPLEYGDEFRSHLRSDFGDPFYGTYECSDGREIAIGAVEPKLREALHEALDLKASANDFPAVSAELTTRFLAESASHWENKLAAAGCPVTLVRTMPEAMEEDLASGSAGLSRTDDQREPGLGGLSMAMPELFGGVRPDATGISPRAGENTRELLQRSGLLDEEITRLMEAGVVA